MFASGGAEPAVPTLMPRGNPARESSSIGWFNAMLIIVGGMQEKVTRSRAARSKKGPRLKLLYYDVSAAHPGHCIRDSPSVAVELSQRMQIDVALVNTELAN